MVSAIRLVAVEAQIVLNVAEKLKDKQEFTTTDLRNVMDGYEDVRDEVHVNIALSWYKACKASNAENLYRIIEVLSCALKINSVGKTDLASYRKTRR